MRQPQPKSDHYRR